MPLAIDNSSRIDELVSAAVHLIDTAGIEAFTLRRLAGAVRLSPSTLLAHLDSKHRVVDLITKRVGDSLVWSVEQSSIRAGMAAVVPDEELLPYVRAWLGLSELAASDDDRHAAVARIDADLRHVLGRVAGLAADDRAGRDALAALTRGLWVARCSRTRPMTEARALAALTHVCTALGVAVRPAPDAA